MTSPLLGATIPLRMGAFTPTLAGGGRNRRPARWARRIAGLLATAALLAVAVAILTMVLPGSDGSSSQTAAAPPAATATPAKADTQAKSTGLTAAQKKVRSAAVSAMRGQGYLPVRLRDWDPKHTLRVLLGYRAGEAGGPRRAFFFHGSTLLGTDSVEPSSGLKVAGSGKRWVTLTYGIYSPGDAACCPSDGHTKVRYELSGSAVTPVGGTVPASYQRVATG